MALSIAAMKLQAYVQKIAPCPFTFDLISHIATKNFKYYSHPGHKYYRLFSLYSCYIFTAFSYLRLIWLHNRWKSYENGKVEQFIVNCILLCLTILAESLYWAIDNCAGEFQYAITQRCQLLPLPKPTGTGSPLIYKIAQLAINTVGVGMLAFPTVLLAIPFAIDYDPIQLTVRIFLETVGIQLTVSTFKQFIFLIFVKLGISLYYFLMGVQCISMFLSILLFFISIGEGLQLYSAKFYVHPMKLVLKLRGSQEVDFNYAFSDKARCGSIHFSTCYRRFRNCQILLALASNATALLFFVFTCVGVLLAGSCGYVTLKLFDELPILFYLSCPVIFALCIVVVFVLTYLADKPNRHGLRYLRFWSHLVAGKQERRVLRACTEIGYCLGPFRNAKAQIGLLVTHIIFQCTANLLLLDGSTD